MLCFKPCCQSFLGFIYNGLTGMERGNYVLELEPKLQNDQREAFKAMNKGGLTEGFFPYHAHGILQLRRQKALVIVDVGGMVQPEKQPILEACSHYLIISSKPEEVERWHEFCRDRGI
jgi:CRISPR-associated protein Csx3